MSAVGSLLYLIWGERDESPAWHEFALCREDPTSGHMQSKSRQKEANGGWSEKSGRTVSERIQWKNSHWWMKSAVSYSWSNLRVCSGRAGAGGATPSCFGSSLFPPSDLTALLPPHHSPSTHFPPGYTHTQAEVCNTHPHTLACKHTLTLITVPTRANIRFSKCRGTFTADGKITSLA